MKIATINPANNKLVKKFSEYRDSEIERRLKHSEYDYKIWKKFALSARAKHVRALAERLRDKKEELAQLITLEMGKPITQARSEIEKCAWVCEYYAENARELLADEPIPTEAKESFICFQPLGLLLAIMPWNFPFWQVFRFAAPAIMAGNSVVLKHASNVPQCALAIENLFREAMFPEGVFQNLLISNTKAGKLISHPLIKAVTLTGSEYAGSKVAQIAGKNIKKTVLELGGSDPFIVLDDANLKNAAATAVQSRMINSGQSCIAAKRWIVLEKVANKFIELVLEEFEKLKVGDPTLDETNIGPLAREDLVKNLHDQVKKSVKKGAKIILGGNRPKKEGAWYTPTLLDNVQPGMPVFDEETFGPVATIIRARDEDHAIELANNSKYGLGASIWTEEEERAQRLARAVQAGCVFVNDLVRSDPRLPFGGIKKSGYGRELSEYGIKEFVNIKTVWIK